MLFWFDVGADTTAGNLCFHGTCKYYCDTAHPVCGRPQLVEGSMAAFLPPLEVFPRTTYRNPWSRTYHKRHRPAWETASRLGVGDTFCRNVTRHRSYDHGRRMLDVIDMTIFDFLTGRSVRVWQGRSVGVGRDRSIEAVFSGVGQLGLSRNQSGVVDSKVKFSYGLNRSVEVVTSSSVCWGRLESVCRSSYIEVNRLGIRLARGRYFVIVGKSVEISQLGLLVSWFWSACRSSETVSFRDSVNQFVYNYCFSNIIPTWPTWWTVIMTQ